jgi:acyl-CoA reductase-like NAD-dependent aldehyde dehydrogenase
MGLVEGLWWLHGGDDGGGAEMRLTPWVHGDRPETVQASVMEGEVEEVTETALDELLVDGREVQSELCKIPLEERLDVLHELGEMWKARALAGELREVRSQLLASTGYSEANIDLELSLVPHALDRAALAENLDLSLLGGRGSAEGFVPLGGRGEVRSLPVGPVLILTSGNSLVPAVIPTAISLALGNCTVVKPSIANYDALVQVFEPLRTMAYRSPAANLMARALVGPN